MGLRKTMMMGVIGAVALSAGTAAADDSISTVCQPSEMPIYFSHGDTGLSAQSEAVISFIAADLKGCAVTGIRFEHPQTVNAPAALQMADARTQSILSSLEEHGVTAQSETIIPVAADGNDISLAARRVNVRIEAQPQSQS